MSAKLIVVVNGQRVSKVVHEGATREEALVGAEAEKAGLIRSLTESAQPGESLPTVDIKDLLLG
jgi:hypothetical protein